MRAIDGDALLRDIEHYHLSDGKFQHWVEVQPTIEPERKKGKWIKNDNGTYSCGICQSWIPEEQHCYARYCLYCGSEMRGDRND